MCRCSDAFLAHIKVIWGTDKLEWTALPLNLIGAKFLREETEITVDAKKSPKWFALLQVTEEKRVLWLRRVDGRFQVKAGGSSGVLAFPLFSSLASSG